MDDRRIASRTGEEIVFLKVKPQHFARGRVRRVPVEL